MSKRAFSEEGDRGQARGRLRTGLRARARRAASLGQLKAGNDRRAGLCAGGQRQAPRPWARPGRVLPGAVPDAADWQRDWQGARPRVARPARRRTRRGRGGRRGAAAQGGDVIQQLRTDTGARIKVEPQVAGCAERVIAILAPDRPEERWCDAQQALFRVHERISCDRDPDTALESALVRPPRRSSAAPSPAAASLRPPPCRTEPPCLQRSSAGRNTDFRDQSVHLRLPCRRPPAALCWVAYCTVRRGEPGARRAGVRAGAAAGRPDAGGLHPGQGRQHHQRAAARHRLEHPRAEQAGDPGLRGAQRRGAAGAPPRRRRQGTG